MESAAFTPDEHTRVAETRPPRQAPCSVALYIDGDNQSPTLVSDLFASLCDDWRLDVSRVVLAGNDHGQSIPRWQAALAKQVPEERVLTLEVPRAPEAADLALILELGATMEHHRQQPDLIIIVSRDEWLVAAAEAVHLRGCRVWVAYAQTEAIPARTRLPTLLLPAVNRNGDSTKLRPTGESPPAATAAIDAPNTRVEAQGNLAQPQPPQAATTELLAQLRAQCTQQPGGGYSSTDVGQVLYQLGLTRKVDRARFLRTIPGLREVGTGPLKRLLF